MAPIPLVIVGALRGRTPATGYNTPTAHFRNRRCLAGCRRRLGRAFALKPAEEASSSRSQSAAAVPDIDAPSRTVRPPFRLFDPFSARLLRFQPNGFQGSRSYLRRHGVQFRRAHISYHKTAFAVYLKIAANRLRKQAFYNGSAGPVPNHFKTYPHLHSRAKRGRRTTQLKISAPSTPQREISTAD